MANFVHILLVCFDIFGLLPMSFAELSRGGTKLDIRTASFDDDMAILRDSLRAGCRVEILWIYPGDFMLTAEHVDILQRCPLKEIDLDGTSCISPTLGDLSNLTMLEILDLDDCEQKDFIITGLPSSLQTLRIKGLKKENFLIQYVDDEFGKHLEEIKVTEGSMCCPHSLKRIFGRELYIDRCIYERFDIRSNEDTRCLREHMKGDCVIETLWVYAQDFTLTTEDVDILQLCPLNELDLGRTSCISPSLTDLSSLTMLETLNLDNCKQKNFSVTGLPSTLQTLRIYGLSEDHFRLEAIDDEEFGDKLKEIKVSDGSMCCRNSLKTMFGLDISPEKCFYDKFEIRTNEDKVCFKEEIGSDCMIEKLWVYADDFMLTIEDVDILQHCPLKEIDLDGTSCISPTLGDLSNLTTLENLDLDNCNKKEFIVTGLPASLQVLRIDGLSDYNFNLENEDGKFGGKLEEFKVTEGSMCCSHSMKNMFSKSTTTVKCIFDKFEIRTNEDTICFREEMRDDDCMIHILWVYLHDFQLTTEDIDILRHCPVREIDLDSTSCISPSLGDLSNLASLEKLDLDDCRQTEFVVTGLPYSLRTLRIEGLTEKNFQLDDKNGVFGDSLEEIRVSRPSICSSESMTVMFGRNLSHVNCFQIRVDLRTNEDLQVLRRHSIHDCSIEVLDARGMTNFNLTRQDVDVLEHCPLETLYMSNTACISSSVGDLSRLTQLETLWMVDCSQLDFVITGLPPSLTYINAQGCKMDNFRLNNAHNNSGEYLQRLGVSDASMCCPSAMVEMFGRDLPQVNCRYTVGKWVDNVKCGFSQEMTKLSIIRDVDILILRHQLTEGCRLNRLFVHLPAFALTQDDVNILAHCPLRELYLADSRCFSEGVKDLRPLTKLTHLGVKYCRSSNFVISGLPASLRWMDVKGLAEFNIRLKDDDSGFGDSLSHLLVYGGGMCCNRTMYRMFSRDDLSSVCETVGGYSGCGREDGYFGEKLQIDSRQELHAQLHQLRQHCFVISLHAVSEDFFLTQEDVDMLARCPLIFLFLPYTSCFTGLVDLSQLTYLSGLFIPHCANLDFTITGLPPTERMDIRGLNVDNIRLQHSDGALASLNQLEVSKSTICSCPQASVKMFGRLLPENTTCGITESTFSASNDWYDGAFVANGLNSAISSCENLIESTTLRTFLWTMAVVATCGNCFVISYRCVWDKQTFVKSHGVIPFQLAMSDLLMGIYLLIVGSADTLFRGEYSLYDEEWRHGPLCQLAGFISTLSSESSAIFILLITFDRFLAIQFPFGQIRLTLKHTWIVCSTVWIVGFLIASLPLMMHWEVYSYNSICVGLPLNKDAYRGSGYASGIFIGVNSVLFLLIAIGQALIYRANWANSKRAKLSEAQAKRRYKQDIAVARQLSLIVITDFLCWFPVCVMGLLAQTGYSVSNSAYAWSAVVVLPINSSINPLLYTLRPILTAAVVRCRTGVRQFKEKRARITTISMDKTSSEQRSNTSETLPETEYSSI